MKAIVCERFAPIEELVYRDFPDPVPGSGQVLVRIEAIGVNFPEALLVQGKYQAKPAFPFVPGAEFAGEVLRVSEGVAGFAPGERVMGYSTSMGAYAEQGAFDARNLMHVPEGVALEQAAALICAHGTAHHALKQRAALRPGETLLVLGAAGGTGVAAVQIGKAMGATVLAGASTPEKLALARDNGADILIDYAAEDLKERVKELTDGRGVDVVYDPVGGDYFDASTRIVARNGRLLVIGFASGRIPSFPVNLALLKEYSVVGAFWGNFARNEPAVFAENMRELMRWHAEGRVHAPIEETYPLSEAATALTRLIERKARGKIVLRP